MTAVEKFKSKTGYDIESFFNNFITFSEDYYQEIVNYYNGAVINKDAFNFLDDLKKETTKIESLINQHGNSFQTTDFWNLNNTFSEIQTKLDTCDNLGKWLRSSRTDRFNSSINVQHIQKQNETLEKIAKDAGFSDVDKWAELAVQNQIIEEDYTNDGGKLLNVALPNSSNFNIDTIVDYLIGDNIFGKDIYKKFEILSDGDLKTISGKESLEQSFNTMLSTIKGSIPEFPEDGIPSEVIGTNKNVIQYPIIFRSLLSMIQKDKRYTSFELLDIKKDQDSIFLVVQAKTITGDSFVNNITT